MLIAFFLLCPIGIAALFGFALFADKHFRDVLPLRHGKLAEVADLMDKKPHRISR